MPNRDDPHSDRPPSPDDNRRTEVNRRERQPNGDALARRWERREDVQPEGNPDRPRL
jgi:hypothetical protein